MELSERFIQQFERDGFTNVYEWQDEPGTVYPEHVHKGKVSLYITDGSITFDFEGEEARGASARGCQPSSTEDGDNLNSFCKKKRIKVVAGERFDVPVGAKHSAVVGPEGWIVIIGEEMEGEK